jgi:hypothetical protein
MVTVRYEERGQGYRDVEKFGKHCLDGIHYSRIRFFLEGNRLAEVPAFVEGRLCLQAALCSVDLPS